MEIVVVDLHCSSEGRTLLKLSWPNEGSVPWHGIPGNHHHDPGILQLGFGLSAVVGAEYICIYIFLVFLKPLHPWIMWLPSCFKHFDDWSMNQVTWLKHGGIFGNTRKIQGSLLIPKRLQRHGRRESIGKYLSQEKHINLF